MGKKLIASMKDDNGVKIITVLDDAAYWRDLEASIKNDLDNGLSGVSVRFFYRTQKWIDALPEYEG